MRSKQVLLIGASAHVCWLALTNTDSQVRSQSGCSVTACECACEAVIECICRDAGRQLAPCPGNGSLHGLSGRSLCLPSSQRSPASAAQTACGSVRTSCPALPSRKMACCWAQLGGPNRCVTSHHQIHVCSGGSKLACTCFSAGGCQLSPDAALASTFPSHLSPASKAWSLNWIWEYLDVRQMNCQGTMKLHFGLSMLREL